MSSHEFDADPSRPVKRRKIDADAEASPQVTNSPAIARIGQTLAVAATPTENAHPSPTASAVSVAQQIWQAARAKSRVYSKRPTHTETGTPGSQSASPTIGNKGSVQAKGRPRKQLDPLRNQQQHNAAASPKKPSSVDVKGFFKKFHDPGISSETVGTANSVKKNGANGVNGRRALEDEVNGIDGVAQGDADERMSEDELSTVHVASKRTLPKQQSRNGTASQSGAKAKSKKAQLDRRKPGGLAQTVSRAGTTNYNGIDVDTANLEHPGMAIPIIVQRATPKKEEPPPPPVVKRTWPPAEFKEAHLACIQRVILGKATRKRPMELIGLTDEYTKVASLIKQTVTAGESNSMLVIGARGSGKTALVNKAIREQSIAHADDFHVVRLNGFLHTDDKVALREIWRQLGREMETDDDEGAAKNYADTLTTLLALLSHPAETGNMAAGQVSKSVLFIIDEFDLFAGHPRQTLLYNLFDIAQSRKAPIAVLGLTTRIDVAETLEKRVKSRFSHRYVFLGLPKTYSAFETVCKATLSLTSSELSSDEKSTLEISSETAEKLQSISAPTHIATSVVEDWNGVVEQIFETEVISSYVRRLYYSTKSIPEFLSATILPLCSLPTDKVATSAALITHFVDNFEPYSLQVADSKLDLLPSLSTLQLALLVCAARLNAIYNSEVISFVLAYEEYKTIASKTKLQASAAGALAQGAGARLWSKDVARGAWEALLKWGFIIEDGRAGGGSGRVDVGLEELGACGVDLGMWARWCREI